LPEGVRSVTALDDVLYVGATEARLFRGAENLQWSPTEVHWDGLPRLRIVTPQAGDEFISPATIPIHVEASDPEGRLELVQFWDGTTRLPDDRSPPYRHLLEDAAVGEHNLFLRALDESGGYVEAGVTVAVVTGTNAAPVWVASPRAAPETAMPAVTLLFTAAATDSDGDRLTYWWDFGDGAGAAGASSTHAFRADGSYNVQATVSDGRGGVASAVVGVRIVTPKPVYLPSVETRFGRAVSAAQRRARPAPSARIRRAVATSHVSAFPESFMESSFERSKCRGA
jgi:hypothetical protein